MEEILVGKLIATRRQIGKFLVILARSAHHCGLHHLHPTKDKIGRSPFEADRHPQSYHCRHDHAAVVVPGLSFCGGKISATFAAPNFPSTCCWSD